MWNLAHHTWPLKGTGGGGRQSRHQEKPAVQSAKMKSNLSTGCRGSMLQQLPGRQDLRAVHQASERLGHHPVLVLSFRKSRILAPKILVLVFLLLR